jgi:hypothetical protein
MRKTSALFILLLVTISFTSTLIAQVVLFDFDNAPIHSSLPIDQTVSGVTAHLSATGQGYSIQNANVLGFTPQGFAGHRIYPNSIYLADLLFHFNQALAAFSIMYSCQELGCDDAATMRVTAYMNGNFVGTNTKTASFPGTWPVDTLSCSFQQGFDSVVVHYDRPPPTCRDYGVIYMADNMRVTQLNVSAISEDRLPELFTLEQNYPNPFNPSTSIPFALPTSSRVSLTVYNMLGQRVLTLVDEVKPAGVYEVKFNAVKLSSGMYVYRIQAGDFVAIKKLIFLK